MGREEDREVEVLESCVTKTEDKKTSLKFLRKSKRRFDRPEVIIARKLRTFCAVMKETGKAGKPETGHWLNNRAEKSPTNSTAGKSDAAFSAVTKCAEIRLRPRFRS